MPNESLIHADAFFFISTIALVVISIGIAVALYYLIKILRNARDVSDRIKAESAEIVTDVRKLRAVLKEEGVKWKTIAQLIRSFFMRGSQKKTSKKKAETTE
ncbi:MAG: hypothetical protein Q8L64_04220 [bacterium]|nr:hypothetical protein [bacterium]